MGKHNRVCAKPLISLNSKENAQIYHVDMHNQIHGPVNISHHVFQRAGGTKALYESAVSPFVLTNHAESGCTVCAIFNLFNQQSVGRRRG